MSKLTLEETLHAFVAPEATHKCGCGEGMYRPGICGVCEDKERTANEARVQLRRSLSVIPDRYRDANFAAADIMRQRVCNLRAAEVARTALTDHRVVVLRGEAGAGKTTIAAAMLRRAAEQGLTIAWAPSLRLAAARAEHRLGSEPPEVWSAIRASRSPRSTAPASAVGCSRERPSST